jgi:hypothetical protein
MGREISLSWLQAVVTGPYSEQAESSPRLLNFFPKILFSHLRPDLHSDLSTGFPTNLFIHIPQIIKYVLHLPMSS